MISYFGAFAQEAVSSDRFPGAGTLFAAFTRSRWTLATMFLAVWTPALASLAMSVVSRKWLVMLCSIPVISATAWVQHVLGQKSYFVSVQPRALFASRRFRAHKS